MTIFSKRPNRQGKRGFTLVEVMITVTLLALVLAGMIPAFTFFTKSIAGLANYTIMSSESRAGLERFSRDLHAVDSVSLANETEMTFKVSDEAGGSTVNYKFDPAAATLTRTVTDSGGNVFTEILFEDVTEFELFYFNRLDVPLDAVADAGTLLLEMKSVQIRAVLLKKVITSDTTDYIISARFLMRNKPTP